MLILQSAALEVCRSARHKDAGSETMPDNVSLTLWWVKIVRTIQIYRDANINHPTPRIQLSVRSFVRSFVRPHFLHASHIHASGSNIDDHRFMDHTYVHHTHKHRDQGSYIYASCVYASGSRIIDMHIMHHTYTHHTYMH